MSCCWSATNSWDDFLIILGLKNDPSAGDELEGKEIITSPTPTSASTSTEKSARTEKPARREISKRNKTRRRLFRRRPKNCEKSVSNNTLITDFSLDPLEENDQILEKKFPGSTPMERKRFLTGRSLERAQQKMESYIKWREQYHLNTAPYTVAQNFKKDEDAWDFAVDHTSKYYETPSSSSDAFSAPKKLPRIVKFGEIDDLRALDGRRIALVLPGLIEKKVAPLDFYARCVGVYLDLKLDRDSDENIYVIVDLRAGLNWPNASPTSLLPFVKSLNQQLIDAMPERMLRTIVYPIPPIAKPIWALFKSFLDKKVVAKISVLWGSAGVKSPIPKQMRNAVFDEKFMESLEGIRSSGFMNGPID
jgi:hypothetical protein